MTSFKITGCPPKPVDRSSARRIGRPTSEGKLWAGKSEERKRDEMIEIVVMDGEIGTDLIQQIHI